jgi:hypothetical protein
MRRGLITVAIAAGLMAAWADPAPAAQAGGCDLGAIDNPGCEAGVGSVRVAVNYCRRSNGVDDSCRQGVWTPVAQSGEKCTTDRELIGSGPQYSAKETCHRETSVAGVASSTEDCHSDTYVNDGAWECHSSTQTPGGLVTCEGYILPVPACRPAP